MVPPVPRPTEPTALAELRDALGNAGFTEADLARGLGTRPDADPDPAEAPVHLRRLNDALPLHTLARLFLYDLDAEAVRVMLALAPADIGQLEAMRLLEAGGGRVRAPVRLAPFDGLLLASDQTGSPEMEHAHVLGVNQAARTLRQLTIDRPVRSALDVGTGCGIHALALARHCEQVVGVDISERALDFARFNAVLNDVRNVAFEQGSWLEPVEGRSFDLIVCNPPFVISPDTQLEFRDSGLAGDLVSRRLVEGMPAHLNEGGYAQMLFNWIHPPGDNWVEPLREWVAGSGCDALVVRYFTQDPVSYAAGWNARQRRWDPAGFERTLERWLEYYAGLGARAIASGLITLRRRSGGEPWLRTLDAARMPSGRAGEHVLRVFAGADALAGLDQRSLLDEQLFPVEGLRVDRSLGPAGGATTARVRCEPGLGVEVELAAEAADVLAEWDWRRPLRDPVAEVAARRGLDADALASTAIDAARQLLAAGLLEPPTGGR